ncbi:MAG: peptide chain release factor 2 [Puniceicoccales bacterium]|jgi:peptide chain release factor 2|nr:peptide chain release factor 2 [Puniceicoccales bacterium]
MYIPPETRSQIDELARRAARVGKFLDVPTRQKELARFEHQMSEPDFWANQTAAQKVIAESNRVKALVNPFLAFQQRLEDIQTLAELVADAPDGDASAAAELDALAGTAATLLAEADALEISSFLTGPHDKCNAILTLKAGAGGTEACDWAAMLLRLYTRWAERRGYTVEIDDIQDGEGAGVSTATFRVSGPNAYGYAKAERGVHRLVRISPFDANARRHTSFAALDVVAEIDGSELDVEIKEGDLKVDVFRASGAGGQHVNRTESAVRFTHLPTGIVVACQRERSQIRNREIAMQILRARVYERQQDEKRAEMEKFYGEKGEIGWGNQIRSYVFQPYQMVKDLRTGAETANIQSVMDGEIDFMINAWLRAGCPRQRNKDIKTDDE